MREGTHCALTFLAFANAALGWGWYRTRPRFPAQRLREGENLLAFSLPRLSFGALRPWVGGCVDIGMGATRMVEVAILARVVLTTTCRAFGVVPWTFSSLFAFVRVEHSPRVCDFPPPFKVLSPLSLWAIFAARWHRLIDSRHFFSHPSEPIVDFLRVKVRCLHMELQFIYLLPCSCRYFW